MIGKITIGKSFRGCLLYCLNDKRLDQKNTQVMKDRAEILLFNKCYGNQKELIEQFNEVRQLNQQLSKPVLHITLSFAPGEKLQKDQLMEICQECARDMGFENNQYVAIHHKDTTHQHLHIVANRIGFDKRTVSDSQNYKKIANYCRRMETKYGLKPVLNPKHFLPKEQQATPRQDARKDQLKRDIQWALKHSIKYTEFELKMKSKGYQVIKGRGILFIDNKKVKVKGSEVGFPLMKLERIFAINKELGMQKISDKNELEEKQLQQLAGLEKLFYNAPKIFNPGLGKDQQLQRVVELEKQLSNLIYGISKSEQVSDRIAPEWLKKKRQRKRLRRPL